MEFLQNIGTALAVLAVVVILGFVIAFNRYYRKAVQGQALVCTGGRKIRISFNSMWVLPAIHKLEVMDISVKRVILERVQKDGLICQDNMRADIKVAFYVRVNSEVEDVKDVAKTIGVKRASERNALVELFDPKFSEALKSVGKQFNFVDLYQDRAGFKAEIIKAIGTDLNGYILDDCAIDYLEQTELANLSANNILDSEGIKKITELTAKQQILSNHIDNERIMTIKKQDVEREEAVLELERQLAETQEKQKREVSSIKAREAAETVKVQQEERLKADSSRIHTEEELHVAEQNKLRQVVVAQKNKERTEAVEIERVEKDRLLEVVERERIVDLAQIEKDRALEVERKNIQDVIRDRVIVEKAVVEEEEKIKDTRAFAEADRSKKVAITESEKEAQQSLVMAVQAAEAEKESATRKADQRVIEAEAARKASDKNAEARKVLAEAKAAEEAASGLAEAKVQEAKAHALEMEGSAQADVREKMAQAEAKGIEVKSAALQKQGSAEAAVIEMKATAEAKGMEAKAQAFEKQGSAKASVQLKEMSAQAEGTEKQGLAEAVSFEKLASAEAAGMTMKAEAAEKEGLVEARVIEEKAIAAAKGEGARAQAVAQLGAAEASNLLKKLQADAQGIREKAEAMKLFDDEGRGHEEFKIEIDKQLQTVMASLATQEKVAAAQAEVISEGLKSANIEIVGGESMFFDKITNSIIQGRSIDRLVGDSEVLKDVKDTFFNGDPGYFKQQLKGLIDQFGMSSEDVKNLSVAALINKLSNKSDSDETKGLLSRILTWAESAGLANKSAGLF